MLLSGRVWHIYFFLILLTVPKPMYTLIKYVKNYVITNTQTLYFSTHTKIYKEVSKQSRVKKTNRYFNKLKLIVTLLF